MCQRTTILSFCFPNTSSRCFARHLTSSLDAHFPHQGGTSSGLGRSRTAPLARSAARSANIRAAAAGVMGLESAGAEAVLEKACRHTPEVDSRRLILNAFHTGKCFDFMQISESSPLEENKGAKSNARWRCKRK